MPMRVLDQAAAEAPPSTAASAVLAPLAALLKQVADRRRARAAKQLDNILTELSAGGGRVGRWADHLCQDGQGADNRET